MHCLKIPICHKLKLVLYKIIFLSLYAQGSSEVSSTSTVLVILNAKDSSTPYVFKKTKL